jgi:hypothetical protein
VERSGLVAAVELDGEVVLYDQQQRTVSVLNPTATLVWATLEPSRDLEAIGADLAERFATDATVVTRDIIGMVTELERQGLVEVIVPERSD